MPDVVLNPAEQAAEDALIRIHACIDSGKSFLLEAGAGAGKTYSLVQALRYLIDKKGAALLRARQQVACITFTNVATEQIRSRTDRHPAIYSSTIHSFCWSLIKDFQPFLRKELSNVNDWSERLKDYGGIGTRKINYDELGYRAVEETHLSLHHDDVLALTIELLKQFKFRVIFTDRYPILFIDEYQDTDKGLTEALLHHLLGTGKGPLIGFFGDHWQKIYGSGCGKIDSPALEVINKNANFRSVPVIVDCLNRMRPELPQSVKDPNAKGTVGIYHTNDWGGIRRTGQHWGGDLEAKVAHAHLNALRAGLEAEGWEFSADKTKILMLTHKVLASEQGYNNIEDVFEYNEAFIKKQDPHIAFFVDILEPVCIAYEQKRFGEMFAVLGGRTPAIFLHADKVNWSKDMDKLLALRKTGTIGEVVDHLKRTKRPRLSESAERRERLLEQYEDNPNDEDLPSIDRLNKLKTVSYQEVIVLARFIEEETPFATKHGVKGAEFENVLVVVGRGWNQYDFNQFLEWAGAQNKIPSDKCERFERNRNLFYVACSRPKTRLAILFTQKLTDKAMTTLAKWFGPETVHSLRINN